MWIKLPDKRIVDMSKLCIIGPHEVASGVWEVWGWTSPHDYTWARLNNGALLYKNLGSMQEAEECINALLEELRNENP